MLYDDALRPHGVNRCLARRFGIGEGVRRQSCADPTRAHGERLDDLLGNHFLPRRRDPVEGEVRGLRAEGGCDVIAFGDDVAGAAQGKRR
jgi:hypothetical protein